MRKKKFEVAAGPIWDSFPQRPARMTGLRKVSGLGRLTGCGRTETDDDLSHIDPSETVLVLYSRHPESSQRTFGVSG